MRLDFAPLIGLNDDSEAATTFFTAGAQTLLVFAANTERT